MPYLQGAQRNRLTALISLIFALVTIQLPCCAQNSNQLSTDQAKALARGEVVPGLKTEGSTRFVTGTILIDQPPDKIWPVITNPYEFLGRISPRMKGVEVMTDRVNMSIMKVTLDLSFLFPHFTYTVESNYRNNERIDFHRVAGILRDFRGSWQVLPKASGKTELSYSMYIDPGFPVPQWMIREGVRNELPKTLLAVKERVQALCRSEAMPESRTILAAAVHREHHKVIATTGSKDL